MTTNADVLATIEAARARTRRVKRAGWIPLLVFGILVLPALLFHRRLLDGESPFGFVLVPVGELRGGDGLFWYWQFAIPLGYVVVAGLYAIRNHRAGVRTPVRTYVVTGVVLVVALYYLATAGVARLGWSNFGIFGLEATVTIGLALFVLAWSERSIALTVAAVVVTATTLVASTYTLANVLYRVIDVRPTRWLDAATNDLTVAVVLLLCAAVVAVVDRTRTRSARAVAAPADPA